MLASIPNGIPVIWTGDPTIETTWTDDQLHAAGLYRVQPFILPPGQLIAGLPTYTLAGSIVLQSYPTIPAPPEVVPQSVSPRQARLALIEAGLYEAVQSAIAIAPPTVQVWWEYATTIDRQNPMLLAFAQQLGLTDTTVDQLFALAASL